jgi:predicted RND superfamily exporter protein
VLGGVSSGFSLVGGHIFCKDSTVALAFISPDFESFDSGSGKKLYDEISSVIKEFKVSRPEAKILLHGQMIRSVANASRIKLDLLLTIGISLILILLALMFCFRSLRIVFHCIIPVAYGAFFAMACMYWIKGGMSLMALGIGAIVLGVAISYCLHVVIHQKFTVDVEKMLKDESTPVCLGCITTIGAFAGLLLTKSELLRDFGLFASFALIGGTLFALIFLPHFLNEKDVRKNESAFRAIDKIDGYPYDSKPVILIVVAALAVVGCIFAPKVEFDSNLKNLGYVPSELKEAEDLYSEKNFGGELQRYYAAVGSSLDEALDNCTALSATLDSLQKSGDLTSFQPIVSKLFASTSEQERRISMWENYWTPERVDSVCCEISSAASRHGLDPSLFEPFRTMTEASYEPGNLYESGILPEGLLCNFIEESSDGKWMAFISAVMDPGSKTKVDDAAARSGIVIDPFYYMSDMVEIIHDDFNVVLMISSLFVLLILLLSFRNFWVTLISFLPMFLSWEMVEGFMAIFGLRFNLINIVISTFIFGIGVDYSIFVMKGLIAEAKGEGSNLLEWHKAAIFFSALALLIVILSLLFAVHPAIKSIGISTLIGMTSTIIITYTLEPFLFKKALKAGLLKKLVRNGR